MFQIDAEGLEWIGGAKDDPRDLCLHGHVRVRVGEALLEADGTVSATALYLLKTLTEDKIMSDKEIQMVPCCGHFLIANGDLTEVQIIGCDHGTDWSTVHHGEYVNIILPDGTVETVSLTAYRTEVLRFADKVEAFYEACSPKELPVDAFDRNGYLAFWNEWHRRRREG